MSLFVRNLLRKASRATPAQMQAMRLSKRHYDEKVLDHYNKPRNVGKFEDSDDVGTGLVGAPACGDVMRMQLKFDENGTIVDSCFKTFGCGSAIASSSFATEKVKGMSIDDASKVSNKVIAQELKLPPVKLHCSMLAEDAIRAAIKDYEKKKAAKLAAKQAANNQAQASQ